MTWQDIIKYRRLPALLKEIEKVVEDFRKAGNKLPYDDYLKTMSQMFGTHYKHAKDDGHEGNEESARYHLKEMKSIVEEVKEGEPERIKRSRGK